MNMQMQLRATFVSLLVSSACGAGSGSHERPGDAGRDGIEAQDFGPALMAARGGHVSRCCQEAGLTAEGFLSNVFEVPTPDPASGAVYDRERGTACVAETLSAPCAVKGAPMLDRSSCQAAWTGGTRGVGDPCTSVWECAPAKAPDTVIACSARLTPDGWVAGECYEQKVLTVGDTCDGTLNEACPTPLLCDPNQKRCMPPAALGEACITGSSFGDTCEAGALCDRMGTKRCIEPKPVGADCESIEECEGLACIGGVCREPLDAITLCDR